ncbi:MAG: energy-coupling factor ABC transporter permease [Actinomycetota bacterium]|nr:energy-coupling factor ABC transporter permease [Actinomycetota bacterium]
MIKRIQSFKRRLLKGGMIFAALSILMNASASQAFAMHISEGILPARWAGLWYVIAIPFIYLGIREIKVKSEAKAEYKSFVALTGAAVFIISCMPIPVPIAGTCSHPCGTGLAAILIGPAPTVVLAAIALGLQALFLAHGGLTTLGANIVAMGVIGAFTGYGAFRLSGRLGLSPIGAAFLAGLFSDWATYTATSFILASALKVDGSLLTMFLTILVAFVPTQLPLGILEGFFTAGAYRFIGERMPLLLTRSPAQGGIS